MRWVWAFLAFILIWALGAATGEIASYFVKDRRQRPLVSVPITLGFIVLGAWIVRRNLRRESLAQDGGSSTSSEGGSVVHPVVHNEPESEGSERGT